MISKSNFRSDSVRAWSVNALKDNKIDKKEANALKKEIYKDRKAKDDEIEDLANILVAKNIDYENEKSFWAVQGLFNKYIDSSAFAISRSPELIKLPKYVQDYVWSMEDRLAEFRLNEISYINKKLKGLKRIAKKISPKKRDILKRYIKKKENELNSLVAECRAKKELDFKLKSPVVKKWAQAALSDNKIDYKEARVLSSLIKKRNLKKDNEVTVDIANIYMSKNIDMDKKVVDYLYNLFYISNPNINIASTSLYPKILDLPYSIGGASRGLILKLNDFSMNEVSFIKNAIKNLKKISKKMSPQNKEKVDKYIEKQELRLIKKIYEIKTYNILYNDIKK